MRCKAVDPVVDYARTLDFHVARLEWPKVLRLECRVYERHDAARLALEDAIQNSQRFFTVGERFGFEPLPH